MRTGFAQYIPLYVKYIFCIATKGFGVSKEVWKEIGSLFPLHLSWDSELLWFLPLDNLESCLYEFCYCLPFKIFYWSPIDGPIWDWYLWWQHLYTHTSMDKTVARCGVKRMFFTGLDPQGLLFPSLCHAFFSFFCPSSTSFSTSHWIKSFLYRLLQFYFCLQKCPLIIS